MEPHPLLFVGVRRAYLSSVRTVIAAAVLCAACTGRSPDPKEAHVNARAWAGPDAVLVRLPASGGTARAYRWGTDSVLWTSTQPSPALQSLIGFDADQGTLSFADTRGVPGRVELRLGIIAQASTAPVTGLVTADGWALYGINQRREVQRLTPSGLWNYTSAFTPRELLPQRDGSLVLMNDLGDRSVLRRLHPPEARITDTASVPKAAFAIPTALGDRIYFATDSGLAGVRVRDLARTPTIALRGPAADAVPTPSGDRVYAALAGDPEIVVISRYEERITGTIRLGAPAIALRMDPDGRYLLARYDAVDSAAVISVAESRVVNVIPTRWRADLPLVAPDGAILALDSTDAVDRNPVTGVVRRRYSGGAADFWALIRWDGFRPRAKGLDQPVQFDADSTDSLGVAPDSVSLPDARPAPRFTPQVAPADRDAPPAERIKPAEWTLSFAALLDEQRARTLAATIRVDGRPVRVVSSARDGATIWRIVYGPFATREEAERAGRRTGLPYWVYEESP